jgi:glycogen phosphorylase/synthase
MKELNTLLRPDYVFEVSWEICNKGGGIHTVLMTKARYVEQQLGSNYILIGPDIQKEISENGYFQEDNNLYSQWAKVATEYGIHVRIGRWNVPGNPITILVDYSQYFTQKDQIYARMWELYGLDSLTGDWDYNEPALFGYAAAKAIESFYQFHISAFDKLIVHCHEWKTGLGILELKKDLPQAGLVFTTHDMIPSRIMASQGLHFLSHDFQPGENDVIDRTGQRAKYSLEKLSVVNADCYTAVSQLNSEEAKRYYNKEACIVTPNGFDGSLIPPLSQLAEYRKQCRTKVMSFLTGFFGISEEEDCFIVLHSSRYEFHNKGTDLFLDALALLNEQNISKPVYAILSVPANHSGPVEHIRNRIFHPNAELKDTGKEYVTHHLLSYENDLIVKHLQKSNLHNNRHDNVKVVYIPAWLDGKDGILQMEYYELLSGVDFSVFPSYYEPWGYTPMESLAFGTPSATTNLTGFAGWVIEHMKDFKSLKIITRNVDGKDDDHVAGQIMNLLLDFSKTEPSEKLKMSEEAFEISTFVDWKNFIQYYQEAFHKALELSAGRIDLYKNKQAVKIIAIGPENLPHWHKVLLKPYFPDSLLPLKKLSQNLWWSWNEDAIALFESIDIQLWEKSAYNPISMLEMLDIKLVKKLDQDVDFVKRLGTVYNKFMQYMSAEKQSSKLIAYFCMEYGLHSSVKLYSGGLGILAGDYIKEASDLNKNFIAIGLLYRYGYFNQKISAFGDQINERIPQKFTHLPVTPVRDIDDNWVTISLAFPGRNVMAKVWLMMVGRISLYLLDTDIDENNESDRAITAQLYGGDWENRLKQELLLGIGGIRMLQKLGVKPDLYHLNEGHAAFLNLERMRFLIQEKKLSFRQAVEVLRSSSLFTTHTPVPAGHDSFDENLLRVYLSHYPQRFNISWEQFMGLGRHNEHYSDEKFSTSILALKLSQECNGVSRLHGKVSREMFVGLYPGYFSNELHISHVTNGVHYSTWTASEWKKLLTGNHEEKLSEYLENADMWQHINDIPDEDIWNLRNTYRKILTSFLSEKIVRDFTLRQEQPHLFLQILENIHPDALTIGFARRFATYKRAHLIFSNPERLSKIVNHPEQPIRFIFAGKAHPNDTLGQELIKKIINWSKRPEFVGKIIFLDNYDAEIARKMVQGVDVWLNTPTRPLEASGTSGQKCVMNGVLHFSVLDGWWAEGYISKAGWALKEARTYVDQVLQDELDAETIYSILENEIIPAFFKRNPKGLPCEWIQMIKKSLTQIAPHFTTRRMMNDYFSQFYEKMFIRSAELEANNYEKAYQIASWKRKTGLMWENIRVIENNCHDSSIKSIFLGEDFFAEVIIDTGGIPADEIGIELLFGQKEMDKVETILFSEELDLAEVNENRAVYSKSIEIRKAGVLDYAIRIFIRHTDLPHRTDFNLIKWI